MNYEKRHHLLFHAATDALEETKRLNFGEAKARLIAA